MSRRIVLVNIGQGMTLAGVLPSVVLFSTYSAALIARGGSAPYTYTISAGALPAGLMLDSSTGIISGTVSGGSSSFTVRATDITGASVTRTYSIAVLVEPLSVTGHAPNGTAGVAYSYTYAASGGVPPYAWSIVAGALPSGVTLNAGTGKISGTPTAGGALSWTLRVTDSATTTVDLPDSVAFGYPALTLSGAYAGATVGTAYSSDLTIAGGNDAYSNPRVTVGTKPSWATLSIVSGKLRLSGTPTGGATTVNITVAVDSGDGQTATSAQSIAVSAGATFHTETMADSPWGYWRLDDTVTPNVQTVLDYSGHGRNGALNDYVHSNSTSQPPLFLGESASTKYQVSSQYVALPSLAMTANQAFTLRIAINNLTGANSNWQFLSNDDGTNRAWQFVNSFLSGSSGPTVGNITLISPAVVTVKGSVVISDSKPHMLWAVFDPTLSAAAGMLKLYVDGVLDAKSSTTISTSAVTGQPAINSRAGNLVGGIGNGVLMGSGAIFLTALSSTRIAAQWAARNS